MKYRVHRVDVTKDNLPVRLEQFLNRLSGEVFAVIPNVTKYSLKYGAKVDYLLVVEKNG